MLTLYYVSTTLLQSWRIQSVCNKIAEQLAQKSSIAFYMLQAGSDDGFDTAFATSELCINRNTAKVSEILWLHGNQRGCSLHPLQTLHITPWIAFQDVPSWLPFAHAMQTSKTDDADVITPAVKLAADKMQRLNLLLEAHTEPSRIRETDEAEIRLEEYGKLIAWKIDSHLAVLIETDIEHFTKLLISTFLRNNLYINDKLPLLRIESVTYEGKPQPFELLSSHLRRSTRNAADLNDAAWQKHLADLRALSVLAHQATEFEYNKNRTEGKAGIVKPDLIPQDIKAITKEETCDKTVVAQSTDVTHATKRLIEAESSVENVANKTNAAAAATASSKLKTKLTEIKKPEVTVIDGRFKTTRVYETTPNSKQLSQEPSTSNAAAVAAAAASNANTNLSKSTTSPQKASSKTSELEKLAAATVSRKQKSPVRAASSSQSSTPSSSVSKATTATPSKKQTTPVKMNVEIAKKSIKETTAKKLTEQQEIESKPSKIIDINEKPKAAVEVKAEIKIAAAPTTPINSSSSSTAAAAVTPSSAVVSTTQPNTTRPNLQRNKDSLSESKPLNVLVYSDSATARESTVATLRELLEKDTYTIYPMTTQQVEQKFWLEQTALLVVCGAVASPIGEILVDYFLHGGKVLSLCSNILHFILPNYRTAEVREHELVQFSYDRWRKVKMMHHIFCYQPSPVKKHFSTESDESGHSRKPALLCPRSIELKDLTGQPYKLDVQVLGTEETWNTPSLLVANSIQNGGKAVFSQVHLETNPSEFEFDESKFKILKQSEQIRLEIFADLLKKYLDVQVSSALGGADKNVVYQQAYFLGRHESKFELLEKLKPHYGADKIITTRHLTMKFCDKNDNANVGNNVLPILIHSCPDDFSTVEYYDNLKTSDIGRLVIYAPLVSSSMHVINDLELIHGIAVLPRQQTAGTGRGNNQWLSPLGCAMFSIQLHIPMTTPLGARLPLIQHIIGAAMAHVLRDLELCGELNVALKWPNDIYVNGFNKIGGLIVNTTLQGAQAIVNIGCALNLNNSKPTVCINDLIIEYNRRQQRSVPLLKYERLIALIFNEIERILAQIQSGDFESFYQLYYALWLHNDQSIKICNKENKEQQAKIIGIDDFGYLKVQLENGAIEVVQPDGNSFDMLKGLIVPKYN